MNGKKKIPLGAVPRKCDVCNQAFKAHTDSQWLYKKRQHELLSVRHQRALASAAKAKNT